MEILSHCKASCKVKSVQLSTNTGYFTPRPKEPNIMGPSAGRNGESSGGERQEFGAAMGKKIFPKHISEHREAQGYKKHNKGIPWPSSD